jgi:hypothetical protein
MISHAHHEKLCSNARKVILSIVSSEEPYGYYSRLLAVKHALNYCRFTN